MFGVIVLTFTKCNFEQEESDKNQMNAADDSEGENQT